VRSTPLFVWFETADAASLQHALATRGIWTRLFERPGMTPSLRVGLCGSEGDWARLSNALAEIRA
jgi:cobalamin biosynthetic protein CobC